MGLNKFCLYKVVICFLLVMSSLFHNKALAEWIGPSVVLEIVDDSHNRDFKIDYSENIYLLEKTNRVIRKYNRSGKFINLLKPPSILANVLKKPIYLWPYDVYFHPSGAFVISFEGPKKFFYNTEGEFVKEVSVFGDAIPYEDGYYFLYKKSEYPYYSTDGNLIKIHKGDLPWRGSVQVHRNFQGEQKYKIIVSYPDMVYEIRSKIRIGTHFRDELKNLYRIESFTREHNEQPFLAYRVFRCEPCEKTITLYDMPLSKYESMPSTPPNVPSQDAPPIIEYGKPKISFTGDIYCWAGTKTEYKILKWTWQGEATAPQTLKATPSAISVALSWEPPREDAKSVTEYGIYRAGDVCGLFQAIARINKNVLQYEDNDLKTGDLVFYQVRAIRGKDHSGYSNKVFAKVSKK